MSNSVLKNASWIIGCRVMQSVLGLFVGMLTARYLGPSNYGIINYAAAIVAFVTPIMQLGFRNTLVHEIINKPDREGKTVGTALVFNLMSAAVCIVGIAIFVFVANKGEKETIIVCILYSMGLLFQAIEMIQYWFQAKLLSKYTSLVSIVAYAVVSAYKIYLLASGKNIYWFALSQTLDFLIISILLVLIYKRKSSQRLSVSFSVGRSMLAVSKHYIVSGVMVATFGYVGSIVLKFFMNSEAVGFYSAAVTCNAVTGFIYNAIIDSARPSILESKSAGKDNYEKKLITLYCVIIFIAFMQSVVMCILGKYVVGVLYGRAYTQSVLPLQIICWQNVFSYIGTVRNIWILAEGKQKYLWMINLSGAIFSIVLNIVFVLFFDIVGAAIATVLTQLFTNVILGFVIRPISQNNRILLKAFNPKILIDYLRELRTPKKQIKE
ncbi:MAG: flippase [Clostridia bacterium]|nr:flippase [Clostridia bacterium]